MIKCALNTDELEFVYGLTKQSIQAKLNAGNPFNVDSYMNYLYNRIQKVADKDRAAQFLAFTPSIIEQVVLNNFVDNVDQIEGYDKISMLKLKWAKPETAIENVINELEQTKTDLRLARILRQKSQGIVKNDNKTKFTSSAERLKAENVLSTTLPSFLPGATKFEKETPDRERTIINNTITKISDTISLEDSVLGYPEYQGVKIRLKAVNLKKFADNTLSSNKLDSITQSEIARSLDIQDPATKGKAKEGVDQVQDRVIVLVTDAKGNPLSFDSSGNIVPTENPNGKYVYQMMRSIRKEGNNYSVRDMYNIEDQVVPSSDVSEIKEYYNIKNAALKEDIMLDITGMTSGIEIKRTAKNFPLSTLLENNVVSDKNLKNIGTLPVAMGNIPRGRAVIKTSSGTYQVDRPRMSSDIAAQIKDVLFSTDISFEKKVKFYNQFIPNQYISDSSKRHDITEDITTGDIFINVYDRIKSKNFPRNTIFEVKIDIDGKVFENNEEVSEDRKEKIKSDFENALTKAFPDGQALFLNYSESLIEDPFSFELFKDGKLQTGTSYIEFIKEKDPLVYIASTQKGFYNKQMLFQKPSDVEIKDFTKQLPVEERFNQLTEEQYLGDLLLEQTPDGKSALKNQYKGKFVYSTPGLFSTEAFKDTDVIHTNDITVDLIPSIQMGNGEVFRQRNEDESIQEYIFAFSKTGYKTNYLDPAVTNRIKQLADQGVTVVTETSARIKDADLVVLGNRNNPGVQSFNLKESFFQKELNATENYINNLRKPKAPLVITSEENANIVEAKAESVNTNKSKNDDSPDLILYRDGKLNPDVISKEDIKRANDFWDSHPFAKKLKQDIDLQKAVELVNSDSYATFIVSGSKLLNNDFKGTIKISNSKGSLIDGYHEAFHAFTQLYLSPQEKKDLYKEVLNYTDKNGNKPYKGKSYLEIEEILAEDFRTYMKKNVAKKNSPVRNKLFRKILRILRNFFGKFIPSVKEVQVDVMSVPAAKELFENLNFGKDKFFNNYQASVDNARFFKLDRGAKYANKINNEKFFRTALSKQDSDLISSSIDSIISDIIDDQYKNTIGQTQLKGKELDSLVSKIKGLNLSALLEPSNRSLVYQKVKSKLQDRLDELNKEYTESIGNKTISKITTLKELQDASVATLETKSGINKYVLLKSQIDDFKNFDSKFKKGERIKGEEWKGIKIVGDYFTHSTIKDNSREGKPEVPAQIIVVSRIEDAKTQYDNYIKGKAKEYTGFTQKETAEESDLTLEQENLLDNIRILQTSIDQFGDPNYIQNETKPTGIIAYHLQNSNFEVDKVKYVVEEDERVPIEETGENPFEENFKKSLFDLADKEVIYILKSLHKIENGRTKNNKLGFKENADFRKLWNTISKLIGGEQSRQKMFDTLKEESKNYPELKQLIETKLPSPSGISSTYAFDVSSSFWHTFSRPSAKFWQLTITLEGVETNAEGIVKPNIIFNTNQSTIELNKIISDFQNRFKISKNKYMLRFKDQPAMLDVPKLFNDYSESKGNMSLPFLRTLGFKLDATEKVIDALETRQSTKDINNLVTLLSDLTDIIEKPKAERTESEVKFLNTFIRNPIGTLKNDNFIKANISALKSFKTPSELRGGSIVNNIASIQASFGFDTPGDTIILPDGNTAQPIANHSSATSIINGINSLTNLEDAYVSNNFLSFLNPYKDNRGMPYNPLALRNKLLNTMFPNGTIRDESKEMEFMLIAGTETISKDSGSSVSSGINTGDLTSRDKLFQAYNMMLSKGVGEFIKHADKKSAFGIRINKRKEFNGVNTGVDKNLWIDTNLFASAKGESIALEAFILDMIASEFDRIQFFEQNPNALSTNTGYNRTLSNGRKSGLSFVTTDSLISKEAKDTLYEKAKNSDIVDIKDEIKNDPELYKNIKESVKDYFNKKSEFVIEKLGSGAMVLNQDLKNEGPLTLAKSYTYNSFINKVEMSNLINGDLAQFKDFTKRVPGSTSEGDSFLYDNDAQDFINNIFQGESIQTYANTLGIDDFTFDGTLNTGVIADPKRLSIYLKDMQESWTKDYKDSGLSAEEISYRIKEDSKPYEEMEEADGAAYLTIDAYRVLRKLANKWSPEQENLYSDIVAGKDIDPKKVKRFFPVYKLHNYGSLMNAPIATTSMYKFAVAPIIPSVAKPGTELYKLHKKMLESGIQMATFKSGSKASSITSKPNTSADNIFEKLDNLKKLNRTDKYVQEDNKKAPIKNNKIHLRYLKDVTSVADKLKNNITVGTQSRVVLLSQLYSMGELVNPNNKTVADEYKSSVENLTNILEQELLDDIGFTVNKDGRYVPMSDGSLERLTRVVREELDSKGSPIQLQNIIDVSLAGSLKIDFSIHPEAEVIEQILVNRISKAISAQKTKGESDVQVPSTFYNGAWSSQYEQDAAIIANELKIQKFLGTNNLPFYRKNKNGTILAKVAIPLNGDFVNLLNLEHTDGETIETRERLNEMIQNETWMEEHGQKVTITGPRIPTDDTNLIEGFEVWHFIDPAAGSTVVVPTEIVAKAGSDFDVDKLFLSFPNINEDGSLPEAVPNLKGQIKKLREENKSIKQLVNQQKRFAQNELIRTGVEILKLPENYGALTKPANTYLLEDQAKAESKAYEKAYSTLTENPTKFFEEQYDNRQFELLMGGSTPLGVLAKKNKQHILNKTIGAKMPKEYTDRARLPRNMRIKFPHNKTKNGNISISSVNNVDGVSISEILSHSLQGVLDRANNDFPVRAGVVKESLSVMLRLIESGVSLPQVVNFIQQPIIQDYLISLAESKGIVAAITTGNTKKKDLVDDLVQTTILEDKGAISYYNTNALNDAFSVLKKNPKESLYVRFAFNPSKLEDFENLSDFQKFSKENNIKRGDIYSIEALTGRIYSKLYANTDSLGALYKTYHLGEYFWNKTYGNSFPTAKQLEKPQTAEQQVALLLEFLNIETQSQGMDNFEINFNPDTNLLMNIDSVESRKIFIDNLKNDDSLDQETISKYVKDSIISSLYQTSIFTDIVKPLFSLRLNPDIYKGIFETINNDNYDIIKNKYGRGQEGLQKYVNAFNNAIVDYIYQNSLSNFVNPKTGLPVILPAEIRNRKVNKKQIAGDAVVKFKDTTVDIDINQIKKDFKNQIFMEGMGDGTKDSFSVTPFNTLESYVRYVVEREYFREEYKQYKDTVGFEERISKRALASSFNEGYIKGNAGFGATKYSYTKDILEFIEDPKNASIVENYSVLQHLTPSFFMAGKGYQFLNLDNKKLIDNSTGYEYSRQLRELGDRSFTKVPGDKIKNDMISDLFKNFSLMAIYQQGTGRSGLSFINALDPQPFVDILEKATIAFQKSAFKDTSKMSLKNMQKQKEKEEQLLSFISNQVLSNDYYKAYNVNTNNYLGGIEATEDLTTGYALYSDEDLYNAYRDAISNEEFDNADGLNTGTKNVERIEEELIKRNLPFEDVSQKPTIPILENRLKELNNHLEILKANPKYNIAELMAKITPESARRETGVKVGTNQDIAIGLTSKNGVTVERAAENLGTNAGLEDVIGMHNMDDQDIRNEIIEILLVGKKDYQNRIIGDTVDEIKEIKQQLADLKRKPKKKAAEVSKKKLTANQPSLFPVDPELQSFYAELNDEQLSKLPSLDDAQYNFTNMPHGFNTINDYINDLKCKI